MSTNSRVKYPRTFHLPSSESKTADDKTFTIKEVQENFQNKRIVVTEKMDGENTTIYSDGFTHARSLDSKHHPSRSLVKSLSNSLAPSIPENMRICGENLFAKHSIHYSNLKDLFQVFSIWENDACLSWKDTVEYSELLGLTTVPVIYQGLWISEEDLIKVFKEYSFDKNDEVEGFVVRNSGSFLFEDFSNNVAKWVRKNHVQTDKHWSSQEIVRNEIVQEQPVTDF